MLKKSQKNQTYNYEKLNPKILLHSHCSIGYFNGSIDVHAGLKSLRKVHIRLNYTL
jgi:hypothetical protein